jgi:hypothetical protein
LDKVGFGSEFKLEYGLLHTFSNLAVFSFFYMKNYYVSFLPLLLGVLCLMRYRKTSGLNILFLLTLSLAIIFVWTLYDGNFFMYGPRFIYESTPIITILFGYTAYQIISHLPKYYSITISLLIIYSLVSLELSWLGYQSVPYSGVVYVPSSIAELVGFNNVSNKFAKYDNNHKVNLMEYCLDWWCHGEGVWKNNFPLTNNSTIFLGLPLDYDPSYTNIPNSQVINWRE